MANRVYVVTLGDETSWKLVDGQERDPMFYFGPDPDHHARTPSAGVRFFWERVDFGNPPTVLGILLSFFKL